MVIFFYMYFHRDYSSRFQTNHIFFINEFISNAVLQQKSDIINCQTQVLFNNLFFEIFGIFFVIFFFMHFHSDYSSKFQTNHIFFINKFISSALLQRKSDFRNCQTQFFLTTFIIEIFGIFLVIFFFMHFHSDYSSKFQTNHIFFINKFISSAVLQRKSDFRNCQSQFFFNNLFIEIFGIFLVIFFFMHFHSDYSSKFQTNQIFFINKFISSAVLKRKSDFRNCQTQFFLTTFILKFLEFFWSYFSSCIFTVIIQVGSRPIIYFSSMSSYQMPFYSKKAIS